MFVGLGTATLLAPEARLLPREDAAPTPVPMPEWVGPVVVVSMLGLVGLMVYTHFVIASKIAEKQGVGGVLALEGGEMAIGTLGRALNRNPRRRRRRRSSWL